MIKRKNIKNLNRNRTRTKMHDSITKCDNCEHEFYLKAVDIHEERILLNNVPVNLVYFACPNCDKIYRISIQDAKYYDLAEDLEKAKKRLRKVQGCGDKEKVKLLCSMVDKKHNRLANYVKKVNETFSGTFVFEASESNSNDKIIKYLP